ncbi:MAG TPA: TIGR03668 family PPOX class F420-dependent oxidoreductase [Blastocatellia bacterium]|nr:TIGR03668 family PPOX class F420-dependent oxidoreductase [Blastocatellia bacterium]
MTRYARQDDFDHAPPFTDHASRIVRLMAIEIDDRTLRFIREHRVARLATADSHGRPSVIPICYVFEGGAIYSPIDEKPKSVAARSLKRVRNIEANPHVSVVIDDYSDDWSKLAYVKISGLADVMSPGHVEHVRAVALLREKYPQYVGMAIDDRPIIKITISQVNRWEMV